MTRLPYAPLPPELSPPQQETRRVLEQHYDAVSVEAGRPDGTVWVACWRDTEVNYLTLSPDGIPI